MALAINSNPHSAPVEEKVKPEKETLSQESGSRSVGPWVPSMILAQSLDLMPEASVWIAAVAASILEPKHGSESSPFLFKQWPPGGTKPQPGGQFGLISRILGTLLACYARSFNLTIFWIDIYLNVAEFYYISKLQSNISTLVLLYLNYTAKGKVKGLT